MRGGRLLYIYGVVDAAPAEPGTGLDGSPLRAISVGPVAAIVSEHEREPEAGEEALWQHEAVVERLMEEAVVLPMRFGVTVADEAAVEAFLGAREAELVDLLAEVRGAVELSVRADLPTTAPAVVTAGGDEDPPSGTEYMRERGRLLRRRDRARVVLHESLTALSRRSVLFAGGAEAAFRGAYLVDAERVRAFTERVTSLGEELVLEVSCTGPWPPYSFVAGGER